MPLTEQRSLCLAMDRHSARTCFHVAGLASGSRRHWGSPRISHREISWCRSGERTITIAAAAWPCRWTRLIVKTGP